MDRQRAITLIRQHRDRFSRESDYAVARHSEHGYAAIGWMMALTALSWISRGELSILRLVPPVLMLGFAVFCFVRSQQFVRIRREFEDSWPQVFSDGERARELIRWHRCFSKKSEYAVARRAEHVYATVGWLTTFMAFGWLIPDGLSLFRLVLFVLMLGLVAFCYSRSQQFVRIRQEFEDAWPQNFSDLDSKSAIPDEDPFSSSFGKKVL